MYSSAATLSSVRATSPTERLQSKTGSPFRFSFTIDRDTKWWQATLSAFIGALVLSVILVLGINNWGLLATAAGWRQFLLSLSIAMSLWLFSSYLNARWLPPYIDWRGAPGRSVAIALVANVVSVYLIMAVVFFVFFVLLRGVSWSEYLDLLSFENIVPSVIITLLVTTVYQSMFFLQGWRDAALHTEQLNSATLLARYETLNAQVNPHFLFNSLNVLSALIRRDPDGAEAFVQGMSQFYRYVLEVRGETLVALSRELQALEAYTQLVSTRFGADRLKIDFRVPEELHERLVVPLALQMLLENAIKHNGASRRNPLLIEVFAEADELVVRNKRVTLFGPVESAGIGLANISERYRLATGRDISIVETEDSFAVRLPLVAQSA